MVLQIGAKLLGLEMGLISRIEDETYIVQHFFPADGALYQGQTFELGQTYCAITRSADETIVINQMGKSAFKGHPCYLTFGLEAYIGISLWVNGQPYGTLNFSSTRPHIPSFTQSDADFVQLMAEWVSATLAQQQVQGQIQVYADTVENVKVGLIIWHLVDLEDPKSLTLVAVNAAASQALGVDLNQLIGKTMFETFPDLYQTGRPEQYAEVVRTGQSFDFGEVRYADSKVAPSILDIKAFPLPDNRLGVSMQNVTERHKMAQALKESETKTRAVLETAADGIIIITEQGLIEDFNPAAEMIFGYEAAEVIGQNVKMLTPSA